MRAMSIHPRGISLRDILPEAEFGRTADIRVTGGSTHANGCRKGDVFVALVDGDRDGHCHVRRAVAAGAAAVVTERPVECGAPFCLVRDTHDAWGRICQALAGQPGQRLRAIGVTGDNGRTATTYLIASVLEAAGLSAGVMGALGYCDGSDSCPAEAAHTTATSAAQWLSRMAANNCSHAVVEISPKALRKSALAGVDFDVMCVAGALGRGASPHNPGDSELLHGKLAELLRPEGLAVLETGAPSTESILSVLHGPAVTVGSEASAEVTATVLERSASEQTFLLHAGECSLPVRTPLVGSRNLAHCLLAAGVGLVYEIDPATIARGLEMVQRIPGRLERLECGQPFSVYVDHCRSPFAVRTALRDLKELGFGRMIVVCGAEGGKPAAKRPWLGLALSNEADRIVLTSDNPAGEEPAAICRQIAQGVKRQDKVITILDRAAAIRQALSMAEPGDCVLLAGKGNEDHQTIGRESLPWDDREVACECLYSQSYKGASSSAA